jgi:hypothetical protein
LNYIKFIKFIKFVKEVKYVKEVNKGLMEFKIMRITKIEVKNEKHIKI